MNAYLQRADEFIQQQIYKYEQKRQGRDYREMHSQPRRKQQRPSRAQTFNNTPPQGPPAPQGWSQEFDHQSQRWYYIEEATGRSQWEPPAFSQNRRGHRHTLSDHCQPNINSSRDEEITRRMQKEEEEARARSRGRASSHMVRPQSGYLGVPQQRPISTSPHPSPYGRLPPGAHLDMKTGEVVTNMFPPDHPMNAR
jgi:hypothetical protein